MCHLLRSAAALVAALALFLGPLAAPGRATPPEVRHTPPVEAPVVDRFRPPAHAYGSGNRGIDYATGPGTPVRSSAAGEITFAGRIGSMHHVVVLHADGLRTSYSFLSSTAVRRGERVDGGQVVGTAAGPFHFGARQGDTYIDPLLLFTGSYRVHLVAHDGTRPGSVAEERRGLLRSLAGAFTGAVGTGVDWARRGAATAASVPGLVAGELSGRWAVLLGDARAFLHLLRETSPMLRLARVARHMVRWADQDCTPAGVRAPPPSERRIVVLVAGLGSAAGDAAVLDVDTAALGYADADVVQFSYRGGVVPGQGHLAGVPTRVYGAADTEVDLLRSAETLRQTLEAIRLHHPGAAVDVIAHSQGGVVARLALGGPADHLDPRLPPVRTLVTLGSPHRGADAATGVDALDGSAVGTAGLAVVDAAGGPIGRSTEQLSETSAVIRSLDDRPLPRGTQVTSIAAAGDLVVAAPNTQVDGAHNVTVGLAGPNAHEDLTSNETTQREIALAVAGLPPTCQPFLTALGHAATGELVSLATDSASLSLAIGARLADRGLPSPARRTPPVHR